MASVPQTPGAMSAPEPPAPGSKTTRPPFRHYMNSSDAIKAQIAVLEAKETKLSKTADQVSTALGHVQQALVYAQDMMGQIAGAMEEMKVETAETKAAIAELKAAQNKPAPATPSRGAAFPNMQHGLITHMTQGFSGGASPFTSN
jgi:hypothetical protein